MTELLLASASPRRQELLRLITEDFRVVVSDADEHVPPGLTPEETVLLLARRKAQAVAETCPGALVIGSDTIVALDDMILGKPADTEQAREMLERLSGREHRVYTGVALADSDGCECFAEQAVVEFGTLSPQQIGAYVSTGEPMDKAGAYGIQGRGAALVRGIRGDYYTVMGLPVHHLAGCLARRGIGWWL